MSYLRRSEWGARPTTGGPGRLIKSRVVGLALHWPGDKVRRKSVEDVAKALRSWQAQHIDVNGWSDIGYQEAIDQAGNVYRLRGLGIQSGANGDQDVNQRYGAVLLVLAIGETPSPAMVAAIRRVITRHRARFPNSTHLVAHSDIRPEPTDCPGDKVRALIASGDLEPRKAST